MEKQFTKQELIDFGNYLLSLERRELFESLFSYNVAMNKLDTVQEVDITSFFLSEKIKPTQNDIMQACIDQVKDSGFDVGYIHPEFVEKFK